LTATASIHLRGSDNVDGNVIARYLSLGDCSEIQGDAISYNPIRFGKDVFVKGLTENADTTGFNWDVVDTSAAIEMPSPFPYTSTVASVVGDQVGPFQDGSAFSLIRVAEGAHMRIADGTIYAGGLIVEDNATITGDRTIGSTIWINGDVTIGDDVAIENYVSIQATGNMVVGKRMCGRPFGSTSTEHGSLQYGKRMAFREDHCECKTPQPDDCYCDRPALVDLISEQNVNIGSDSSIRGAILGSNVIVGNRVCLKCHDSPWGSPGSIKK